MSTSPLKKSTEPFPKINGGEFYLGPWLALFSLPVSVGIVPIINRFLEKKVPSYTAVPFLVTAPVINPIVLFATYSAFGNSIQMALLRAIGSILVATVLGIFLGFFPNSFYSTGQPQGSPYSWLFKTICRSTLLPSVCAGHWRVFRHWTLSGLGCLFASVVQVYVPTRVLTSISATPLLAILLLMLLSFLLSLCSEADAFIGSSLLSSFGLAPVLAFLVIGPMLDVKNLLMMKNYLTNRFIVQFH